MRKPLQISTQKNIDTLNQIKQELKDLKKNKRSLLSKLRKANKQIEFMETNTNSKKGGKMF